VYDTFELMNTLQQNPISLSLLLSYYVSVHFPWVCIKSSVQIHVYDAESVLASRWITVIRMWCLTVFF